MNTNGVQYTQSRQNYTNYDWFLSVLYTIVPQYNAMRKWRSCSQLGEKNDIKK